MPTVGYGALQIIPSMKGFGDLLSKQTAGPLSAAGKSSGAGFATAFGGAAKLALGGVFAGLGAGLLAGGALVKIGGSFDDAFDTIRIGTGATGKEFLGLQEDFKKTFAAVPTTMGEASTAVADLNTRLGLSGKPLQRLSTQMLNLSRITKTDVGGNVADITRVFGDWGVSTKNQSAALDQIFRASQSTGTGINQLSQGVVKFGAPLRQLGFSFEDSLAMLGKFDKEGVNTELVVGSMRIALGKMARSGEPAQETFKRVTEEIKNAGSTSEANALALELFGARAGPDMAAAIREGRFEIDDLAKTISEGGDTINGVAGRTDSWREKLNLLGNKALVALQPLATKAFDAFGSAITWATPYIERFATWFSDKLPKAIAATGRWFNENLRPILGRIVGFIQGNWRTAFDAMIGFFKDAFEGGKMMLKALADAFGTNQGTILKVLGGIALALTAVAIAWNAGPGLIVLAVVGLAAALLWAYKRFAWFKKAVDVVFKAIAVYVKTMVKVWKFYILNIWVPIVKWIWKALQWAWEKSRPVLKKVWKLVKWAVDKVVWYFKNIWWPAAQFVWKALQAAWDLAKPVLSAIWSGVKEKFQAVKRLFNKVLKPGFEKMKDIFQGAWDRAKPVIDTITSVITGMVSTISVAFLAVKSAIVGGWNAVANAWNGSVGSFSFSIPGWMDKVPGVAGLLAGKSFDMPNMPVLSFHTGGLVPGARGADVPAVLQAGELVLTAAQQGRLVGAMVAGRSDGGDVYITMPPGSNGRDVVTQIRRYKDRNGGRL